MTDRQDLKYTRELTAAEAERLRDGHISDDMDDKWHYLVENDTLQLYRSWTGTRSTRRPYGRSQTRNSSSPAWPRNADRQQFNADNDAAVATFDKLLTTFLRD